ncbi:MAG: arginase family protein, partial [Burkholderiales bacterium]
VLGMDEFEMTGVSGAVEAIRQRCADAPIYITFDLDALDPCDAPAAANLEPGYPGLRIGEAVRILRGLRGLNIVGGDVVCMVPSKDNPNLITAMNSMVLMYEFICLIAHYLSEHKPKGA